MEKAYSLFELNEFVRRIMALNFPESIWVKCEIAQINQSRGHYYLELVEKGEGIQNIIARSEAVIWSKSYRQLLRKRGAELNYLLQEGMEVQFSVKVDFHEQYGLKLVIQDIDPTYTLGKMELKRRETIKELKELDLIDKNGELPLPNVLQKIAVISSGRAAGYQDYLEHLNNNDYGYVFYNQLFEAAMQGVNVESDILYQLKRVEFKKEDFDCVVIIRGGGAKLDLAAFDSFDLCKAIADFPVPIFTGIGHDIDETVSDLVAHESLKTPTAVADFLIQRNLLFESTVVQLGLYLSNQVNQTILSEKIMLEQLTQTMKFSAQKRINRAGQMLEFVEMELPRISKSRVEVSKVQIENFEKILQILDPKTALKRGFTLTSKNGKVIQSTNELKAGDVLKTVFEDGEIESIISK